MFKRDPLSPVRSYFHNYAITGVGLFLEGYGECAGDQIWALLLAQACCADGRYRFSVTSLIASFYWPLSDQCGACSDF